MTNPTGRYTEHTKRHSFTRRHFVRCSALFAVYPVSSAFSQTGRRRISVKDFDAKGDGIAIDTTAIQRAIDVCSGSGGGVVQFPAGTYVTGTILIKSGVTLAITAEATLVGSLNPEDYRLIDPFVDGVGTRRGYALLGCVDAHRVGIAGEGTIDGRGAQLQALGGTSTAAKPFLLLCSRSTQISVTGVRLINSSAWTFHISQCKHVTVTGVNIRSIGLANNDGIDIDSSENVRVDGCTIETGDDAICLKTTSDNPCTGITVTRCTLTTRCAAFKIGTESAGNFSKIHVSDCHIIEANLGAVKILSVDGARISDVLVERLRVDSSDTPIFLRLGARGRTFRPGAAPKPPGILTHIVIRDVEVHRARRIGILLAGIPGHCIEDVSLDRITINMMGEFPVPPFIEPPEATKSYPEVRMFGPSFPSYGIYGRHVRSLAIKTVKINSVSGDPRPESFFSDDRST